MKVLIVRPFTNPTTAEVEDTLASMQSVVGGPIEEVMPWADDVALICNGAGKLLDLMPNRVVGGDIICGTFFLVYAPLESETYQSLPEPLLQKYIRKFTI